MNAESAAGAVPWQPTASLTALKQSASLRRAIRDWMETQEILEVWTPALSMSGTTDPQVESLVVLSSGEPGDERYLHTSPEFAMKRILCAYPEQDIYQIATVFRSEEQGRYHTSQFNMLEWYRTGMDHLALMQDVEKLFRHVWDSFDLEFVGIDRCSYSQEVFNKLGHWPDELPPALIKTYFNDHQRSFPTGLESYPAASLDLFVDEFVLPGFHTSRITFLSEYPSSQAALARIGTGSSGQQVAERFEVYLGTVELANGFHELADASMQRDRFKCETQSRELQDQRRIPMDEYLLSALSVGLPDCAGIALGLDRLQMVIGKYTHINQVLSFGDEVA